MGDNLDQQTVIIREHRRAGVGGAAVQTDAVTGAGTVHRDLAGIRKEVVGRVFRGHTGLDRVAAAGHGFLRRDADGRAVQRKTFRDKNLRLHDINAGHHLRDRVFHLNPWIHLNEIRLILVIHQELQRAGIAVPHLLCQTNGAVKDNLSGLIRHSESRCVLHHLLMTALYGTVTVQQMYYMPIIIGENLYFDMLRFLQIFLQENLIVTESQKLF